MKTRLFLMVMGLMLVMFCYSTAQVPQLINYQGKLTSPSGAPVNDTVQMIFSIYSDEGGTNLLWTETQTAVIVEKGVFNVLLGSVNPISFSVFDGSTRYLGVKVGGDPEITPRKAMVSVAYAYTDGDWTKEGNDLFRSQGNVGIGTASPTSKLQIEASFPQPNCVPLIVKNIDTLDYSHSVIRVFCSATSNRCQPGIQFLRPKGPFWEISVGAGDFVPNFLGFAVSNMFPVPVMVIDTLGKVGIGNTSPTGRLDISNGTGYNQVRMRTPYTPSGTSDVNGNVGDIAWDNNYFYVKTNAGWKRSALSTW